MRRKFPALRNSRGLTAVELLVAMSVLALLASMAAPAMQRLVASQRLRTASFDLMADLTFARSEALKRAAEVTVTARNGSWSTGWTVNAGSTVLAERNALGSGVALSVTPTAGATFDASGRPPIGSSQVSFQFSNSLGGAMRCVRLDPTGRPKSAITGCS